MAFKREKEEDETDYLNLDFKEKTKLILKHNLKWSAIFFGSVGFLALLLWLLGNYDPWIFIERIILIIVAFIILFGGCFGGVGAYKPVPKMRIVEPDDTTVIPTKFQIRVRYDEKEILYETLEISINEKKIPHMKKEGEELVYIPEVFKKPPKAAVSLEIVVKVMDIRKKFRTDRIRVICDPEADQEDYLEYWEFKREKDTYWGKEVKSAKKSAKKSILAQKLISLGVFMFILNAILTGIVVLFRFTL